MSIQPSSFQPMQFAVTANTQPIYYAGTTPVTAVSGNGSPPPLPAKDVTPVERKPAMRVRDRILAKLRREDPALAEKIAAMPLIAGAASEAETEKTVELVHRKKIVLKRNVTTRHKDVKGGTPTHSGSVELVRTLSGDRNEISTIGIKSAGDNSGFVEIPVEDLLAAVEELRDSVAPKS